MNRSVAHGSFSIERAHPAPPKHVFAAWSSHAQKNRWFGEGDDFLETTAASQPSVPGTILGNGARGSSIAGSGS